MRYEVMRLLQFVFSLALMFGAFLGGMFVGWRRWGRRGPVDLTDGSESASEETEDPPARRDLFAPELDLTWARPEPDLRVPPGPVPLGLPSSSATDGARAAGGGS